EGGVPHEVTPLLDGSWGWVVWALTWVARGHFLPPQIRGAVREALGLRREGFGLLGWTRSRIFSFDDRKLVVPRGVFPPQAISLPLMEMALDGIATRAAPIVVEVGTGSGAIALSLGARRPD